MSNKEHWIKIVRNWEKSGEVAKYWCKKHKVPYISFITWRKKITSSSLTSFIEVVDTKETSNSVEIEYKGFTLRLEKGFDETLAKKSLNLLRGL